MYFAPLEESTCFGPHTLVCIRSSLISGGFFASFYVNSKLVSLLLMQASHGQKLLIKKMPSVANPFLGNIILTWLEF